MDSTPWGRAFNPQTLTPEQQEKLAAVREGFVQLAALLQHTLPDLSGQSARYKSLTKTKLEEAAMFATKSFTHG